MITETWSRKNGTVTISRTDAGWTIVGESTDGRAFRMTLPACKPCAEWTPAKGPFRPVCPTIHRDGYGGVSTPTIRSGGHQDGHARKHCHGNHGERVKQIVERV